MPKYTIYHSTEDKNDGCWKAFATEKEALEHARYEFDKCPDYEESLGRKVQTLNEMSELVSEWMDKGYEFKYEPSWFTTTIEIDDDGKLAIIE